MGRRSRSRGGGGGHSRRALLGGGAAAVGGAALVARSGAFSQSTASREASIDAADDSEALVGVDVGPPVESGVGEQELVSITNNTGRELSASVGLVDPDDGEAPDPTATIDADEDHTFSVEVDSGADAGEDALPLRNRGDRR